MTIVVQLTTDAILTMIDGLICGAVRQRIRDNKTIFVLWTSLNELMTSFGVDKMTANKLIACCFNSQQHFRISSGVALKMSLNGNIFLADQATTWFTVKSVNVSGTVLSIWTANISVSFEIADRVVTGDNSVVRFCFFRMTYKLISIKDNYFDLFAALS